MDSRFLRSQRSLRTAVLQLAAEQSPQSLSVAAVCRVAGVTRDTFYRHAGSPVDLLASALGEEIAEVVGGYGDMSGLADFRAGEHALLTHVAGRAVVYRNALDPQLLAPLRANLERVIRDYLRDHLSRHPENLPVGIEAEDLSAVGVVAAYAAAGTVGAVEAWLAEEPLDVERGVRLILAASPEFWFRT
ncbi:MULTISPECIES: hypothetical protein [unclassified Streptomyces]|uniref:TetR/AcrR family transcriptional regulator n=1 Tax=unclassified Streptomyces TaxID=2593676 RepID=UPI002E1237A9|nr:TetR family transcriptional regulator [Streptomyces sp. NBC_01201]